MAHFQALQSEEYVKLMGSQCFLAESIADKDLESTD